MHPECMRDFLGVGTPVGLLAGVRVLVLVWEVLGLEGMSAPAP